MPAEAITSRQGQWLEYCADRLRACGLDKIVSTAIVVQKFPWNRGLLTANIRAGIFVTLMPRVKSDTAYGGLSATNLSKVVGYGAQITLARASNQNLELDDTFLRWREIAEAAFEPTIQPAAAGLDWVENMLIEQGPILDSGAFVNQYDVQAFVARAVCRERRGRTV